MAPGGRGESRPPAVLSPAGKDIECDMRPESVHAVGGGDRRPHHCTVNMGKSDRRQKLSRSNERSPTS